MPRSRVNDEQVGRVIRTAREAAGMSIDELAVDVKRLTGLRRGVSREAMRRLEEGLAVLDNVPPAIMAAICYLLGLDLAKLAPKHAAELDKLESFLLKRRDSGEYPLLTKPELATAAAHNERDFAYDAIRRVA